MTHLSSSRRTTTDGARSPRLALLLRLVDESYEKKAWHGPNLRGSIRGIIAEEAARHSAPGRHSIQEIVVHAAYWKYAVRRQLAGSKRGSFPLAGSNWFERTMDDWKRDVALLDQEHRMLRETILGLRDEELEERPAGSKHSRLTLIAGIAAHDVYHAGQIQLTKKLIGRGLTGPRRGSVS